MRHRHDPHGPFGHSTIADVYGPGIDDEARELALKRTSDLARKIKAIAASAELPPEAIPALFSVYQESVDHVVAERRAPKIANRVPMEISSGDTKILPGQCASITARPQWLAYRIEDLEIEENAHHWLVLDLIVGNRSQKVSSGEGIHGKHFAKGDGVGGGDLRALMRDLRLETLQTTMDFVMTVEYRGPIAEGERFKAQAIGTAAIAPSFY